MSERPDRSEDLRRRRAEVSRQAIRDAVTELLATEHPASLSIPAVAERAGVSVRTVYRHFPTKQDLLDDVSEIQQRRADAMVDGRSDLFDRPGDYLVALWSDFERDVDAVRAQHRSPLGTEIRLRRMERSRAEMQVRLDKAFPDAPEEQRRAARRPRHDGHVVVGLPRPPHPLRLLGPGGGPAGLVGGPCPAEAVRPRRRLRRRALTRLPEPRPIRKAPP